MHLSGRNAVSGSIGHATPPNLQNPIGPVQEEIGMTNSQQLMIAYRNQVVE